MSSTGPRTPPSISLVHRFPASADLSAEDRERLEGQFVGRHFAEGEQLFVRGAPSEELYFVLKGEILVAMEVEGDEPLPLARLSSGEILGEMGVVDHCPRSATATALTAVDVGALSRERYQQLARAGDRLADWLLEQATSALAGRIHRMTERIAAARMDPEILRQLPQDHRERARRWWQVLSFFRRD